LYSQNKLDEFLADGLKLLAQYMADVYYDESLQCKFCTVSFIPVLAGACAMKVQRNSLIAMVVYKEKYYHISPLSKCYVLIHDIPFSELRESNIFLIVI
jgi:hypothetical protein